MGEGSLQTKHLRSEIEPAADGTRIYVSRRWPRGIAKGERFSEWMKELAPSTDLLDAYLDGTVEWETYERRFHEELETEQAQERLSELTRRVSSGETITLLCDHPADAPEEECHRFLLEQAVEDRLA